MAEPRGTATTLLRCFMVLMSLHVCVGQSRNDSIRLMEDMLSGYHRKHRPVLDQSDAVEVNVTFEVVAIQGFDEVEGTLSVVVLMRMVWIDEVINWEPASYGGMTSQIYDVEDIWHPLLVIGSSSVTFKDLAEDWMTLRIHSTGHVFFSPGLLIKSKCSVDVTYYPFDSQKCHLMFTPWVDSVQELKLNAPVPFAYNTFYVEHGEWNIIGNSTYVKSTPESDYLYLVFILERKPLFAVTNTILPIILMSVLNLMVFVLPAESGERVSYTITVLLAIAVFLTLVADSLPKTSEPMSILAFFLLTSLIISASICIATVFNLVVYHRSDCQPVSSWQRCLVRLCCCNYNNKRAKVYKPDNSTPQEPLPKVHYLEEEISWQNVANAIDKMLLIAFSAAGVINIVVFVILLTANTDTHDRES